MGSTDNEDQKQLKALLRWRRLKDELENSEEELQVLRSDKSPLFHPNYLPTTPPEVSLLIISLIHMQT